MKAKCSLADDFIYATYDYPRHVKNKKNSALMAEALMKYRMQLLKAEKFLLDDEFVKTAMELSNRSEKELLARLPQAFLPFGVTWMEMGFSAFNEARTSIEGIQGTSQSNRLGMLLVRDEQRPTAWSLAVFRGYEEGDLKRTDGFGAVDRMVPMGAVYLFDSEEHTDHRNWACGGYRPMHIKGATNASEDGDFGEISMKGMRQLAWGYGPGITKGAPMGPYIDKFVESTHQLEKHVWLGLDHITKMLIDISPNSDERIKWLLDTLTVHIGDRGILRFVVTALALLNDLPTTKIKERLPGTKLYGHVRRPYSEMNVVSLNLPKSKPLQWAEKKLEKGEHAKKRYHSVREHDRRLFDKNGNQTGVTRVSEHNRGDESLGTVKKEYRMQVGS